MNEKDLQLLIRNDHRIVRLHMKDGELVTAKVLFVSETEQDVIVDLISSTTPARYEKSDVQPAFQYSFADIDWVESIENLRNG